MNDQKTYVLFSALLSAGLAWWLWKDHPRWAGFFIGTTFGNIGYAITLPD